MLGLPIGFAAPWVLIALGALPVLWFLLRAVPPAPIRRRFPGVVLLLGLEDDESVMDRTPWWLLLLRMCVVAAAIIGFAGPVLNPQEQATSDRPLLIALDGGWASAPHWRAQSAVLVSVLEEADRLGRDAAILRLTTPAEPEFLPAGAWARRVAEFEPLPWQPDAAKVDAIIGQLGDNTFDTLWVSDGLAHDGRSALIEAFESRGDLQVVQRDELVVALSDVALQDGILTVTAQAAARGAEPKTVSIMGKDPTGAERVLATGALNFEANSQISTIEFSLPAELRGRVTRFQIDGVTSAGATYLTDDSIRRREIAIVTSRTDREGLELLSPSHYLRQALVETAEVIEGSIPDVLPANPDVIILPDVATLAPAEQNAVVEWAEAGGLLLRFAGPQLAASDLSRSEEHPLMPVRLRAGGRTVGGAMSWGEPKALAPFGDDGPFAGLTIPDDLRVTAQVVAQPDPNLAERVLAELSDGTPLVTRKAIGQGQVVLFHVTANAEWSGLPLSGLFVQMLDRLAVLSATGQSESGVMEGTTWQPLQVLDGQGRLLDGQTLPGVGGVELAESPVGAAIRPGLYRDGQRSYARNVLRSDDVLVAFDWPAGVTVQGLNRPTARDLTAVFLSTALILLLVDTFASLILSGRMRGFGMATGFVAAMLVASGADAQQSERTQITDEIALAYVLTGDRAQDDLSFAGLYGLSNTLYFRTSVEPADPVGVDLERDELAFFPFLYWPVQAGQPRPSAEANEKLNQYLRSGGMILFDTRDSDVARLGASSPNGRALQQLASALDIPALEPIPADHVLTRTFYLLQDFPGRYVSRDVWVEAAAPDAEQVEGMPFRNLNDGVTPVIIGGNDWASAWATNRQGTHLYPVGRGSTGERQRELAYRFGVNLIMHVLTGNYKSDQVHVPALLDRLGQ
ncbi:DUF4159 domain-containing protein [Cognatishimia sp. 1_MG-2023]|uniref:DUF4159 domain-containing protein n=1 Tax=Cognatishimia sp. 1_MG-2023 TaxID=3062642 RepID=UPI0026E15BAD|nr:DUF4159 domain-containing protein [Cognatishimia sp. 1_MG-2023]MDO6726910.1 DUF4159 domain-containing protein [Cognatishimia sp. 1_MG-2023]